MINTGLFYNKSYFQKLSFDQRTGYAHFNGESAIKKITDLKLIPMTRDKFEATLANVVPIQLFTTYPGLLIGSGSPHEIGSDNSKKINGEHIVQNELRLGLFFDHASGFPAIPGSSIKGVLRNAFNHQGYIKDLLDTIFNANATPSQKENWDELKNPIAWIKNLEKNSFEGEGTTSPYERDCFYKALPISSDNDHKAFLGTDYITPHEDPLGSPNPVQFLKILPRVTYEFNFRLFDRLIKTEEGEELMITASQKRELFLTVIKELGLGAKTNVGYGQFREKGDDQVQLSDLEVGTYVECLIEKIMHRENEDQYQIYFSPLIKQYKQFLDSLGNKPFPSIKVGRSQAKHFYDLLEESKRMALRIKKITPDKRILLDKEEIRFTP